jgi:hypothetical protein
MNRLMNSRRGALSIRQSCKQEEPGSFFVCRRNKNHYS